MNIANNSIFQTARHNLEQAAIRNGLDADAHSQSEGITLRKASMEIALNRVIKGITQGFVAIM